MDCNQKETEGAHFTDHNHNDDVSFCDPSTELCIACGEIAVKYNNKGIVIKRRQVNPEYTYQALFDIACNCFSSFRMNPSANQNWDFTKDPFPFCKPCENQIVVLADLFGHVSQLKNAFKQKAARGEANYANLTLDTYSSRYNERYIAFRKMVAPPGSRHIYSNINQNASNSSRKRKASSIQTSLQSLTISDHQHQPSPKVVAATLEKLPEVQEEMEEFYEKPVTEKSSKQKTVSLNGTAKKRKRTAKNDDDDDEHGPRLKVGLMPNFPKNASREVSNVNIKEATLHKLTKLGSFRQLRMFIENGGCVKTTDANGNTLLHSVLMAKVPQVFETVGFLLDALANPVAINNDGMTPFEMLAVDITQQFHQGYATSRLGCLQLCALPAPEAVDSETPSITFDGITCDGCEISPINNIKSKCLLCQDFDLCSHCLQRGLHAGHAFAVARTKKQSDFLMKFHQKNFSRLYAGWSYFLRTSFGHSNKSTGNGSSEIVCTSCSTILEDDLAFMCLHCNDNLCNSCWKCSSSSHFMAVVCNAKQRDAFLKLFRYEHK